MPHFHPDERAVIILSGTLYYGLGEHWDEGRLIPHLPGTFFSEPPQNGPFRLGKKTATSFASDGHRSDRRDTAAEIEVTAGRASHVAAITGHCGRAVGLGTGGHSLADHGRMTPR